MVVFLSSQTQRIDCEHLLSRQDCKSSGRAGSGKFHTKTVWPGEVEGTRMNNNRLKSVKNRVSKNVFNNGQKRIKTARPQKILNQIDLAREFGPLITPLVKTESFTVTVKQYLKPTFQGSVTG